MTTAVQGIACLREVKFQAYAAPRKAFSCRLNQGRGQSIITKGDDIGTDDGGRPKSGIRTCFISVNSPEVILNTFNRGLKVLSFSHLLELLIELQLYA